MSVDLIFISNNSVLFDDLLGRERLIIMFVSTLRLEDLFVSEKEGKGIKNHVFTLWMLADSFQDSEGEFLEFRFLQIEQLNKRFNKFIVRLVESFSGLNINLLSIFTLFKLFFDEVEGWLTWLISLRRHQIRFISVVDSSFLQHHGFIGKILGETIDEVLIRSSQDFLSKGRVKTSQELSRVYIILRKEALTASRNIPS